jgi:hypothetical protein
MTRMKTAFAVVLLTAIVNVVPQAKAQTLKVVLAGSSAQWQSLALGAYNAGKCVSGGTAPCFHYTNSSFNLTDTRPTLKGGTAAVDTGNVWIVWDSAASPDVWAFIKVDSGVGDRCYYAQPRCDVGIPTFPGPSNIISSVLWGDGSSDTTPPASVQALFTSNTTQVSAAASDIRPEDALFATCRANSKLGGGTDGLAGLGYNANNASGVCLTYSAKNTLAELEGADVASGYPGSTSTAHVLAFSIGGKDPWSGTTIPTATTVSVGATPVIPIISRTGALAGASNATDSELQELFSGADCNGNVVGGAGGSIAVYLREPLSGTMNTIEYSVFRYWNFSGASQETGVGGTAHNPLVDLPCTAGGARWRAIGTGEEVKSVLNSNSNNGMDGIGYAFFSYGNISSIANNADYGYLTLDGVDGIFHKYGTTIDPGQPATAGVLPAAANLPAACSGAFPCPEKDIWSGNLSFPNLRNGSYRAWTDLRSISNGTALTALQTLVDSSQTYVVNSTPDFVPYVPILASDPGLPLVRSHYLQEGVSPLNVSTAGDKGGDAGGCILTSTRVSSTSDETTGLVLANPANGCVVKP